MIGGKKIGKGVKRESIKGTREEKIFKKLKTGEREYSQGAGGGGKIRISRLKYTPVRTAS